MKRITEQRLRILIREELKSINEAKNLPPEVESIIKKAKDKKNQIKDKKNEIGKIQKEIDKLEDEYIDYSSNISKHMLDKVYEVLSKKFKKSKVTKERNQIIIEFDVKEGLYDYEFPKLKREIENNKDIGKSVFKFVEFDYWPEMGHKDYENWPDGIVYMARAELNKGYIQKNFDLPSFNSLVR